MISLSVNNHMSPLFISNAAPKMRKKKNTRHVSINLSQSLLSLTLPTRVVRCHNLAGSSPSSQPLVEPPLKPHCYLNYINLKTLDFSPSTMATLDFSPSTMAIPTLLLLLTLVHSSPPHQTWIWSLTCIQLKDIHIQEAHQLL